MAVTTLTADKTDALLYDVVAQRITTLIEQGTLRPGQRIPSVRRLSVQMGVSISTVLEAYRRLEDRRIIEARPQSGYYVRAQIRPQRAEPEISAPRSEPAIVGVSDLIASVFHAAADPRIVPLGAAVASVDMMPERQLVQMMGRMARQYPGIAVLYDFPPGNAGLRTQIARRALDAGCVFSPNDIITTCGSQEAINLCLRTVTRPGDAVAIESPTYYGLLQTIESLHLKAVEIPTSPRDGVCLDALKSALRRCRIKACLFIPSYNNPLGSCMPNAKRKQLVDLLAKQNVPLIEDDVYGELPYDGKRMRACKSYDTQGLVMLCGSFSKTLAPGLRIGWCAPGQWHDRVERLKFTNTIANASITQMAVAAFLANGGYDHHLRRLRRVYATNVQLMTDAIGQWFPDSTRVTRPRGGFVLWVELPKKIDSLELHRRALAEHVGIAPGPIFTGQNRYRNFIRLNCGQTWSEQIANALRRLGRLAADMATS